MKRAVVGAFLLTLFFFVACGKSCDVGDEKPSGGTVIIALSSDPDMLNPLLGTGSNSGAVLQFLFPDLAEQDFDSTEGTLRFRPSFAKSWEWKNGDLSLIYHLRSGMLWNDSTPITAEDIKFSYTWYAHPVVASPRRNYLNTLIKNKEGQIDLDRAIQMPDDSTVVFNFSSAYPRIQQLLHTQLNFVPAHIFQKISPEEVRTSVFNREPVTAKHFYLSKWVPKQEMILEKNPYWTVPHTAYIDRIVFRIIPEMSTRVVELKTGTVDIVEGLSPEDAADIEKNVDHVRIETQPYRRFEYLGWNHIDGEIYKKSKHKIVRLHPIFGNKKIRMALTMAIRRDELVETWLGIYGQISTGPISPAFKWAYNDSVNPILYDPESAKSLLAEEGWKDHDGDGILDKDGKKFEFTITTNSGNPRRAFALQKIQSDLKKIGIVCHSQLVENNVFHSGLKNKEYEAFITGHNVNMTIDLLPQYGSDLERNTFNAASYQNKIVDSLIIVAASSSDVHLAGPVFKTLHRMIYEDQPVTYLYWYDNIVGINERVKGTNVDILSPYHRYYDWYILDSTR